MTASPFGPTRTCRKSPRTPLPQNLPPGAAAIPPRWTKCSLTSSGFVNDGEAASASSVCVKYTAQSPRASAGPPQPVVASGSAALVPYHATSTRPASPATTQGKMFVRSPGVGIVVGRLHVSPSSRDDAMKSWDPFVVLNGTSFQTTYTLPARSTATTAPATEAPGTAAMRLSAQESPLGSAANGTAAQRAIRTSSPPRCFASAAAECPTNTWWVTGLTSA